jgi:diguanylate cyclase (GGDEF)-like protein
MPVSPSQRDTPPPSSKPPVVDNSAKTGGGWRLAGRIGLRAAIGIALVHLALMGPLASGLIHPAVFAALAIVLSIVAVAVAMIPIARLLQRLDQVVTQLGDADAGRSPPARRTLAELDSRIAELQERARRRMTELSVARTAVQRQSRAHERLSKQLIRAQRIARLGSFEWDRATHRVTCSPEVFRLLRLADGQQPDAPSLVALVHPDDRRALKRWVVRVVRGAERGGLDLRVRGGGGDDLNLHLLAEATRKEGRTLGLIGTVQDATERTRTIQQIHKLAYYDVLTELPNRSRFHEKLAETLEAAHRSGKAFALMFLDLDQFKRINDTMGHDVGDELLRIVAQRLTRVLRIDDASGKGKAVDRDVCRQGGDEFIVLLNGVATEEAASRAAMRVIETLAQPIKLDSQELFLSASIGLVLYPRDGEDLDSLLKNADVAMYHAKGEGRNRFSFYDDSMRAATAARLSLESDLRRAIENEQFELHYQPQIDVRTNTIVGMEALIRWNHPKLGKLWPQHFIKAAEDAGLIMAIWEWVFVTTLIQHNVWREHGIPPMRIGVNVSTTQFSDPALATRIQEIASVIDVPLGQVELELTESALAGNFDEAVEMLQALRGMGVKIAIDDFGTGYSSLSYLRKLPIDRLKLDHTFTADITSSEQGGAVAKAILDIARALNLEVVAEGVETQQQIAALSSMGCHTMQGYLLARPMPAPVVTEFLHLHFGLAARLAADAVAA